MSSRITESRPPDADWTEQERELLAAARADRMPVALEARLRDALQFPASHPPSEQALRLTFNRTTTPRQLFAGKLPLWGALGLAVVAALSYYALMPTQPQPMAAAARSEVQPKGSPRQEVTLGEASAVAGPGSTPAQSAEVGSTHADGHAPRDAAALRAGEAGPATARRGSFDDRADEAGSLREHRRSRPTTMQPPAVRVEAPRVTSVERGLAPGPQRAHTTSAAHSGSDAAPDQLRLEAELLQRARSALGRGALSEAGQWLARYRGQFARGLLQPESQVLGIELNVRTGARTAAKSQADRFISQHPDHPLRERVQQLTADP